ncbi:MAG: RAMP superfamily CRISPR-associated protein [Oscillatoria sp. PMC 1051.18]|nr:RAMP superfamily CRISPR-associated protein [Oscillatoria sp. PMC 1050.18]MEC5032748.1 RAMP superfamily CRISPR-associated protein [Oscillatoria sp. PMC 1051.18]
MKKKKQHKSPWDDFLAQLKKEKHPLDELLSNSQVEDKGNELIIFVSPELIGEVEEKRGKIQKRLSKVIPLWRSKRLIFRVQSPSTNVVSSSNSSRQNNMSTSPLQALNQTIFGEYPQPALKAAVAAEKNCQFIYQQLKNRTEAIATSHLTIQFTWRVRVGGTRGFQDILLPVFHPVYGIPYVPASSLKGVVRAWALNRQPRSEITRLLGSLDEGIGKVQFLDAFPTKPCLVVDMVNPLWSWSGEIVNYQAVPHAFLSMEKPELCIGLACTSKGNSADVETVKDWLQQALASGIGSRVSAGYGRSCLSSNLPHSSSHEFELWTPGMYGAFPPNKEEEEAIAEFRPTAVRGMLRYWWRSLALGIYPPSQCRNLEASMFGAIEPTTSEGSLRISVDWEEQKGSRSQPYYYWGNVLLEAKQESQLILLEKVLKLAAHLGGIGRGSRRPLHWNNPYPGMRGCHWELVDEYLPGNSQIWQQFLQEIREAFLAVATPNSVPANNHPGKPNSRRQDVLNNQSRIYLLPQANLLHPHNVNNWNTQGTKISVRGEALDLLYENRFKGVNQQGQGNVNVGGSLETPSYVIIKSNLPPENPAYQAVTIFGANQQHRAQFVRELSNIGARQCFPLI